MITIKNVTKKFSTTTAVNNLSWEITPGKVIGLLGPNGAGKTTTMRMITGFYEPNNGSVELNGTNIADNLVEAKKNIGYLPENNPLYEDMVVREYLEYIGELKGLNKEEREKEIQRAAQETGITDILHRPINELSKGYKQRTGFAQAILARPDILILDEPTEGLDPNQRVEIRELIRELGKNHTVIISTHVMQEVEATCDHVIIMKEGQKVTEGDVNEIIAKAQEKKTISLEIEGPDIDVKVKELTGVDDIHILKQNNDTWRIDLAVSSSEDIRPEVFNLAKNEGWTLLEMYQKDANLEEVFRELTK